MKHKSIIRIVVGILLLVPITAFSGEWTPMSSGTTNNLYGVWGSSGSDVFAVGGLANMFGTILHYNGSTWSAMIIGGITTNSLNSVWGSSASDVFAVGYGGTILHYNGSTWSAMTSGTTQNLRSVWGSSGSDVFAVGYGGTILHYNGSTWSPMTSGTTNPLLGVWGSSGSDVFAVGGYFILDPYYGDYSYDGYIFHYNGSTWSPMTIGTTYPLNGVWGSSGSDVFSVGGYKLAYEACDEYAPGCEWCDVWCRYWVIDQRRIIKHFNGINWSETTSNENDLHGVWGSSTSDVFSVGGVWYQGIDGPAMHDGYILHYNGSTWSAMTDGTSNPFNGIWGSSASDVFAVGDIGTILHYTETPTVVDLSSFTVTPAYKKVNITWTTATEINNAGFNVYRAESENGEYVKINSALIPAKGNGTSGATYQYVDNEVKNRTTYYYKLEDIDLNATSTMHGPVSAVPRRVRSAE